jgi:hypothetical protein
VIGAQAWKQSKNTSKGWNWAPSRTATGRYRHEREAASGSRFGACENWCCVCGNGQKEDRANADTD